MTDAELAQIAALRRCSFSPGSTAKSFVRKLADIADAAPTRDLSEAQARFLDNLAHQYRRQIGRCMSQSCLACEHVVADDRDGAIAVALDAYLEGRHEFDAQIARWRRVALAKINERHKSRFAHPYEYATRAKPEHRRAETRGDVFCRFCGEQLFCGVKQPHQIVRDSAEAQRHLTICALQVLAGMREPVALGYRVAPLEDMWNGHEPRVPLRQPHDDAEAAPLPLPLIARARKESL